MIKNLLASITLSLMAVAPAAALIDTLDNVPAATLLLPYFAVDVSNTNPHTVASIGNATANDVLAHVVLWTDRGVPTFSFDVRLGAYAVEQIDLSALFVNGTLPITTAGTFGSCTGVLPTGPIAGATLTGLRNAHRGLASSLFSNQCAGVNHSDNLARGYVTIDSMSGCSASVKFPADSGYFVTGGNGLANNDNVLFGEYTTYDTVAAFAQGDTLVAIEASSSDITTDGVMDATLPDYTFYSRQLGSAADNREALPVGAGAPVGRTPKDWTGRYVKSGSFTSTTAIVWRDPGSVSAFACANPPADLSLNSVQAFDEQEHLAADCNGVLGSLPYATQSANLGNPGRFDVPFNAGWIVYQLGLAQASGPLMTQNQSFVAHVLRNGDDSGQLATWVRNQGAGNFFNSQCPVCSDGIDNDGDALIDFPADSGCRSASAITEKPQCSDGLDNDAQGDTDYPADPDCWGPLDNDESNFSGPTHRNAQCDDGVDNDGNGKIDFPEDPFCINPGDDVEAAGRCDDGVDNDSDGFIDYPADLGCTSASDNDESNVQCHDGIDNDGDGNIDFPADPGCANADSNNEAPQCDDQVDNDSDGDTDFPADQGCASRSGNLEGPQCDDGVNNGDADGLIDFPNDPGCASPQGTSESPQCDDGSDNDGDGDIDFPADPGCSAGSDTNELDPPECNDGVDNNGDGKTDFPNDPACQTASDPKEQPDCNDGADNDGDGLVDFPNDPGCASANDNNELAGSTTRQCSDGIDNDGDGLIDSADTACTGPYDDLEFVAGQGPPPPPVPRADVPAVAPLGIGLMSALLTLVGMLGLRHRAKA